MTATGELVVVVVAPTGRDARLICDTLSQRGILSEACSSVPDLCRKMGTGVGAVVLAEEVLIAGAVDQLSAAFALQPKWSDIGLILLTSNGDRAQAAVRTTLQAIATQSVVVLERPVRMLTLASTVASALNSRKRQYELRERLEEHARQEERLRQAQKLESLGVLAGGIAHDFNNLLTVVLGNASLALDAVPPGSSLRRLLTGIVQASERAARLTAQLLAYAGKARFFIESLDLSEHVRQISSLLQASIPRTVQLRLELATGLPRIEADAAQIQQVVMNLVINAAEAIPEGQVGTVLIATETQDVDNVFSQSTSVDTHLTPGRYVSLEVRDSGTGMDETTMGHIFDPFFTTKFTGRGLGLAAVLGIVRGHKGGIRVYSTPGHGTTFKTLFPATADQQRVPEETEAVQTSLAGTRAVLTGTILVVDDEEGIREMVRSILEQSGYTVIMAENGEEAIRIFREVAGQISAVLLDMTMPVMSGEETLKLLRAINPDVPVLLSSGFSEIEALERFPGKAVQGFVQKPYNAAHLVEKISGVAAASRSPSANAGT